jgi:peptidoglycan/xylan/chitin deacetylase (PgdA/CDA1 family)
MRSPRYWAKDVVYGLMGVVSLFSETPSAILMYHDVDGPWGPSLDMFDRQMGWLTERFRSVRLCDLPQRLPPAEPTVVITFDDGYRATVERTLPVLARHGVRATFFIPSGLLGSGFVTTIGEHEIVDEDGVRTLVAEGHEIGGHTLTHPLLTQLDLNAISNEVTGDRNRLGDLLGFAPVSFAYPKGAHDEIVRRVVRDAGYRCAVTVREGLLEKDLDPWTLPRVQVNGTMGMVQFRSKLSVALRRYERLRG